ncbi:MAG: radical SAM family heme chaperone HemW [Oscillospiraceae bacterium]|nr:radical SAM family heme chaperone HemW [Oscillospiraceae bacterium]
MDKNIGIYIHIPFCKGKCAYCNFYSLPGRDKQMPDYLEALVTHIKESESQLAEYYADTVYFGGGTPLCFGADRLVKVFDALKKYGRVLMNGEVTVEVNPESTTYEDLVKLRRAGFNRLSIGAQSANDDILKTIGRRHNFSQVTRTVKKARDAGFENISLDLIYGLPSQSMDDWSDTLRKILALKPEHLSCYGLKLEEGTPLYSYRNSIIMPDDDTQADMYLYTVDTLEQAGYRQYEISNFSKPGFESKHYLKYWQGKEYMGFGPAAHSYVGGRRYGYISDLNTYINNILNGGPVVDQYEDISRTEMASEYIMLGMRTTRGISPEEYKRISSYGFERGLELLESYRDEGWAVEENGRWRFTPAGFLLSNVLIGQLLDAQMKRRVELGTPWRKDEYATDYYYGIIDSQVDHAQLFNGI